MILLFILVFCMSFCRLSLLRRRAGPLPRPDCIKQQACHPRAGAASNHEIHAIKTKLLVLPDDYAFICGHGSMSTIGEERASNPFLV